MAAYNEESVQWLYDKLQDGYDTGSLDEFKEDLKDDETRKWYHNEATKMGLNVGDEDTFRSLVVPEEVEAPQRTGTVVDQTMEDINHATGHMPQEVQDKAFSGQPQMNGQSLAQKNNPQMFQQPAVDPEPWKAEGLTKEQYEDIAWTRAVNAPTRQAVDEQGRTRENAAPGQGVAPEQKTGYRTYQVKESWGDELSREPSRYGELRAGWRRGARFKQLGMDGLYLSGYVGQTNPDAAAQAEGMSDAELIATHNRLSSQINKNYVGGISGFARTPEGQQIGSQLEAIEKELHARDLGFAHASEMSGKRGEVDYRSWTSDPEVATEVNRLSQLGNRDAEIADLYLQGMSSGDMSAAKRAMLASAALYAKENNVDMDTAYAKVEGDAFNAVMRDRLAGEMDAIYNEEKASQEARQVEATKGIDPGANPGSAAYFELQSRRAGNERETLNAMTRRAINESPASKMYYNMQMRSYMRQGMDPVHAKAAAMNDLRNLFRDREVERMSPSGDWGYVGGSAFYNNMPAELFRGLTNLATDDYEYDQILDEAYVRYGKEKASTMAKVGASVAPFVVDMALGSFKVPGMVAKIGQQTISKGLLYGARWSLGVADDVILRRMGGNILYRTLMGGLGGGLNFMTYNAMSAAVRGFKDNNFSWNTVYNEGKRGFADGIVFGGVNGLAGKVTDVAKGAWAIPAELGVLAVEGGTFTALDYMRTGELTPESVGTSFGMAIAGRMTHFGQWASDVAARVNGTKWKNTVTGPVRLSKETRDELQDRYPEICRLMSDGELAKAMVKGARGKVTSQEALDTGVAIEKEWEAMQNDNSVPFAVRRMVNYALNGQVTPKPVTCNYRITEKVEGEDGEAPGVVTTYGETLDINGNVIDRYKLESKKDRVNFEQGVALEAERNRIGLEQNAYVAQEYYPHLKDAVEAVAAEYGMDPNELLDNYYKKDIKGKAMRKAVDKVEQLYLAEIEGKTDIVSTVNDKYGVDIEEALKVPIHERSEAEHNAIEEYEQRLTGRYDEAQDKSTAELITEDMEQSRNDGFEAQGDERADIKERLEDAANALAEMRIDPRQFDSMDENAVSDWLESRGNNADEVDAVMEYLDARSAFEGIRDRVQDEAGKRIEEATKETDDRTNNDTGMIHPVVMGDDREAFVVSGRVVVNADGTIDLEKSDRDIVVRYPDEDQPVMTTADKIKSGEPTIDPEAAKQETADGIMQEVAGEAVSQMNRDLAFNEGDTFNVLVDGRPVELTVVGTDPNTGNPILQDSTGRRAPAYPDIVQQMHDEWREWVKNGGDRQQQEAPVVEQPTQSAGPRDNVAPVEERPAEEQAAGPAIMPAPSQGDPQEMLNYFRASGMSDRVADRTITNNIVAANERLNKAERELNESKETDPQKLAELDRAVEEAQRDLDYWNAVARLKNGGGETAAQQRPTEQAGAPVAENEMRPIEEPTAEIGGTAEEYQGYGMSDEMRERMDDGTGIVGIVDNIARQLGLKVRDWDGPEGIPGYIDPDNGVIYINRNRVEGTRDTYRFTLGHELTHGLKKLAEDMGRPELYEALNGAALSAVRVREGSGYDKFVSDMMNRYRSAHYMDAYDKAIAAGMSKAEAVEAGRAEADRVTQDFIEEEIVCDTVGELLSGDESRARELLEQVEDKSVMQRIKDYFTELLAKVREAFGKGSKEYDDLDNVINRFNEMYNEVLKQREEISTGLGYTESGVDGETSRTSDRLSVSANFEGMGFKFWDDHLDADGKKQAMEDKDGNFYVMLGDRRFDYKNHITAEDLADTDSALNFMLGDAVKTADNPDGRISPITAYRIRSNYAKLLNLFLDLGAAEKGGVPNLERNYQMVAETAFRCVSTNGDKQYGVSLDITRICKKNEAVINTISELQRRQGYGATPAQILDIYLTTHNEGYQVPCPVCYVFSRYIRNGKFASAAIAGMEMYGEHLPGGSGKEWTVQQWMDELKKLGGLKDDSESEDGGEKNEGSKMFKDMSKAANDAITRNLTLIDNAGMRIAREMNKENPDEAVIRQCEEDIRRLAEEYRKATDVFNAMSQTNWIKNFAIRKTKAGWVMWEDARMPEDMEDFKTHALDLRLTADTIENYPAIQRLRRSGGSASGKEIHQASNNEIGEAVMGLGQKGAPQYRNYYKEAMETADPIERDNLLKTAREKYRKAAEFAAKQNLRGGQRMWSWSDNIERLSPDVISNLMQMEILGAGLQSYSKQLEGVEMVARMNGYVNGSLMGKDNGYREVDESKFDKDTMRLTDDLKDTIFDTRLKENRDQIVASKGAMVHEVDGKYYVLIYDDVLGIDAHGGVGKDGKQKLGLFDLNNQYDRAGNILVTMNDMHSKLALADDRVHFIIPWHSSGANQHILAQMFSMLGQDVSVRSTDYTSMQEEKDMGNAKNDIPKHLHEVWDKARQHAEERGWAIGIGEIDSTGAKLTESQKEYRRLRDAIMDGTVKADPKNKDYQAIMADEFLRQAYETIQEKAGGKMTADDKKYIYPYEYWDKSSTLATADENGWRYMEYCRRLGRRPKFSGKYDGDSWSDKGDFTESKGYWKTLIDRRMYGNGETPEQCRYQDMTPIDSSNFDTDIVDRNAVREKFNPTQVAEEEGVTRIVDIVQDTERRRIGELRPNLGMGAKRAITAQNKAAAALKEVALTAKEKKEIVARAEGDKKFSLPETTVDESPDSDAGVRFSIVQDPGEIEMIERELARDKEETGEYEVRYRAMALIDNELHQPMASMEDGKLRDGLRAGDIERSDEIDIDSYITPEIRQQMDALEKSNKKGDVEIIPGKLRYHKGSERGKCTMQFHLVKPDGTDLWAAYNPYLHMSNTPLNDQFSSAWRRPELVVVRVLIPRRELSSGYAAKYAKNATGDADWKSGPVNGALPKDAQRKVTLSRYCKIAGIVPVDQAVDMYADKLLKNNVTVPFNTVTPAEREELYRRGVKIGAPDKGSGKDCMRAYIQWVGEHPDGPKGGKRFSVDSVVAEAEQVTETNPTDGQKESGNYRKGHVKVDGFDISIEQPKGSVRSGVDADGKEWIQEMHNTYGYIRGTEGVDGDHIDVFLSDHLDGWNGNVYVVDQVNKDRSFDEHKVMYGFNSEQEAREAYLSNYEEGWTGLGNITGVSREEFKKWVDSSHRKNKPFAEYKNVKPLQSTGTVDRARFSISERTDEAGNEVYTETREDGTKDREVVTMPDGSRDVTWFDEAGRKKEVLSYYPNGEVRQVNNYDSEGDLTRLIQYDENRRKIRHWEPRIGTDWERDENGVARGMSNGVEMVRYSLSEEDRDYMDAVERGDTAKASRMVAEAAKRAMPDTKVVDENGEPLVVYHVDRKGSGFTEFDTSMKWNRENMGSHFGTEAASDVFAEDRPNAKKYAVYLDIKNPLEVDDYFADDNSYWANLLVKLANENNIDDPKVNEVINDIHEKWPWIDGTIETYTSGEHDAQRDNSPYQLSPMPELYNTLRDVVERLGYDGFKYMNLMEDAGSYSYVAFRPEQIKSAEAVTYDDDGDMIPLSQRFDEGKKDIRFSLGAPYQGSKNKIAKDIVDILPKGERFVDLFSGGGAVTHAAMLSGKYEGYRMNDINPAGQELFLSGMRGDYRDYQPREMTPEEFKAIKGTPEGLMLSYSGFGRNMDPDIESVARRVRRVQRLEELKPYADQVEPSNTDYREVQLQPGDVVYADIPYEGTNKTGYRDGAKFDKKAFSDWALDQDVPIYVSEQSMPEGWTEILSIDMPSMRGAKRTERLFVQSKFYDQVRDNIAQYQTTPAGNIRFNLGEEIENYRPEQVSWERGMLDRLLQNAAINAERNDMRKQATREVNRTLRGLFDRLSAPGADAGNLGFDISRATQAAARAQRGYDRWTVDELVSMAKSMLKSGMYKELRPYEVQRLVNMINQGVGRREIQDQMNTVFDVLMKANLRGWSAQLKKLMSTKPYNINSQTGVRTIGQVDGLGGRILTAMRRGLEMTGDELTQRIAEVSDRIDSDDTASHELEGLMLAQQYNDLIGKYDADNKNIKDLIREQQEKVYDFYQVPVLDEDGNPKYHQRTGEQLFETRKRLKPEFGGLDAEGNRQPVSEENKALRQRVEATVAGLENSMRENWVRMSEGYDRITDDLGGNVAAAVTRAKEFRENEKLRKQQIYHAANSDLLGVEDNTETVDPSEQMSPANWSFVRGLLGPLATFEKMMRFFGRRSAGGEGRLFNMFVRRQIDCGDREWRDKKAGMDEMDNKAKELFGKKWMTMGNEMRDGKKFPFITLSYFDKTGKPRTIDLRQDEAVYLYCVNKMRDGQMKLNAMGIDGDMVEQIVQRLDPRLVELADWYQGEFLPKHRNRYNETYERMFGTPMAHIDNYIHLNINKRETASNQELGQPIGDQRGPTYVTGSLKERTTNVTPIELRTSIFDLAWSEHDKMEHWNAWGEFSRDLKDLTNYRNFKAKVMNMKSVEFGNGKELLDNFSRCAAIVTGDYDNPGRHAKIDRAATNLAKGVTSAKIGFRAFTALKQTLSFPAFFSDARPDDLLFAIGNAEGTIKWAMENLPGFSKRWQSRQAGDTRLMETDSDWKVWKNSAVKTIGRYSMLPNASVDCLTVAIGARGVYRTAKRRYLSYGFSEAQAEKRALQDAAISYNASQQSSEGAFTSAQQVDRTLAGVATTVFRNASMGYERRFTQGLRNLKNMAKRGYREEVIENTKKQMIEEGLTEEQAERAAERVYNRMKWHSMADVVNFGFVLPFFWNLGPAMVYILGGKDDKQKQELVRDSALHALYGPIEGLSMGGTISELANIITGSMLMDEKSFKETMQGLRHRNFNPLPIVSDMQSVFNSFATDTWSGVNDVFNIVVQMGVGVNPETVTNMTWGIIDACQGDMDLARKTAFAFLRFINAPSSQVDKLYMDELGITKDEASRMSWDELAKKYARYHAVKDATVIAPFLSDEAEEAREERYVDRFYDRAQEKLDKAVDEELQRVYGKGDEAKKMVAKETAKRAGLKDDRYGKKPDSDTKPETAKAIEAYQSKRSYADMAEDVLLQKAKTDAANAGDDDRADAIEKVLKSITKLRNGDSKKGVKGMGVDKDTDKKILEKIRETRSKALKELKITR